MKTIGRNRPCLLARPWLAVAVMLCAGSAQAQSDETPEPPPPAEPQEAQPLPEPQAPQPPQPQAQPFPQPHPAMPDGPQPYMNWRPLEGTPAAKEARSVFTWDELPLVIALEGRTTWPQHSGTRRLVGQDAARSSGVSASYDVLKLKGNYTARVDLGWASMRDTNVSSWSSDEEELRTRLVSLGLSLRFHLFRWLAPYVRLAGGIGWDKLTVGGSTGRWRDKQYFAHGSAGGGICLRSPSVSFWPRYPWLGLAFTFSAEGGYFLAPDGRFSLKASSDPNIETPIPTTSVPVGEAGRSAPYLRFTVGLAL